MDMVQIRLRAFVTISAFWISAAASWAQVPPRLERLEVAIWPEYDQPSALVMLRGFVPADVPLPTVVPLAMPVEVGEPNAVAKRSPDGQGLLLAAYTVEARDRWKIFGIETDSREVRLEFYVPMDLSQPQREFVFEWPGGIDVGQIFYEIQQPVGATDMVIVPPPGERRPGPDGLTYAFSDLGPRSANEAATIAITYTKSSPGLSSATLQPSFPPPAQQSAPAPAQEAPATQPADDGSSQWMVTVVIVVAVGILLLWFVMSGKKD